MVLEIRLTAGKGRLKALAGGSWCDGLPGEKLHEEVTKTTEEIVARSHRFRMSSHPKHFLRSKKVII